MYMREGMMKILEPFDLWFKIRSQFIYVNKFGYLMQLVEHYSKETRS